MPAVPIPANFQSPILTGKTFGRLHVAWYAGRDPKFAEPLWLCMCQCGRTTTVSGRKIVSGNTKSCGCLRDELKWDVPVRLRSVRYSVWQKIKDRCLNPKDISYPNYGGRGITICQRWRESYDEFCNDMEPRPSMKYSIDRVDNDDGYHCGKCDECKQNGWPANCRWATRLEQNRNTRKVRWLHIGEECKRFVEWLEHYGVERQTFKERIKRGWTMMEAIGAAAPPMDTKGHRSEFVCINGRTLRISQWRRRFNVTKNAFNGRIAKGFTLKQALGIEPPPTGKWRHSFIEIDGVKMKPRQWATKLNVNYRTYRSRIARGISPQAALGVKN